MQYGKSQFLFTFGENAFLERWY